MNNAARIWDVVGAAKTLSRFEFVAEVVARKTARKADRDVTSGLYVRKTRGGWVYGYADMPEPSCQPTSADRLYDMIRRTALNVYVQSAEDFRAEAAA